ncbi:MAG: hypothetical protein RLZZ399_701 [Verrucomicrobiota bacterium]
MNPIPPPRAPLSGESAGRALSFQSTCWTQVRRAQSGSEEGRQALSDLCAVYYEPVVAFLRCRFRSEEEARDLGHAFFAELLGGGSLLGADSQLGKFRSYLLGAVKHFASRQQEAAHRLKRGGGLNPEPWEEEILAAAGSVDRLSPESEFDRQWALTVLSRALATLESECLQEGKAELFEKIKPHLAGESAQGDLDKLAPTISMHPDALRKALQRLRRRWRENVKSEIAATLDSGADVQEEMEALLAALRA